MEENVLPFLAEAADFIKKNKGKIGVESELFFSSVGTVFW